ncbi:hypothetical protein Bbelb_026880 [Branchiostoma belcheri]|nr:hypothetical protein Bbelb_026880 [Branchiostoma belcheri]
MSLEPPSATSVKTQSQTTPPACPVNKSLSHANPSQEAPRLSSGCAEDLRSGDLLQERREAAAVSLFKAKLNPEHPLNDLLVPAQRQSATGRAMRNGHNITVPYARTKRLQRSFLYCVIRLYNNSSSGSSI